MLTPKELEIIEELCSSLSDVKRKKALDNLLFEYRQYMVIRWIPHSIQATRLPTLI